MTMTALETVAVSFATTAKAFFEGARNANTLATPFARSTLAMLLGTSNKVEMVEAQVIALAGSPRSPKTGKPVTSIGSLGRAIEEGETIRKAWESVLYVFNNVDADEWLVAPLGDETGVPGARAIRPMVEAFILESEGSEKAIGTKASGLRGKIATLIADHATAFAALNGVEAEAKEGEQAGAGKGEEGKADSDHATALATMLVRIKSMDDAAFTANQALLAELSDYIDARWNAIDAAEQEAAKLAANG